MLLVSQIIDNAREIKSKIGNKSYDDKVLEYYTKLANGLDLYPKTDSISDKIKKEFEKWSVVFDKSGPDEANTNMLKKLKLPDIQHGTDFMWQIKGLINYDDSELRDDYAYKGIEFDTTCFPRAMLFYICILDFNQNYTWTGDWKDEDVDREIKKMPETLNFYKDYIKDMSTNELDSLSEIYWRTINNVNKETFIKSEIVEHSIILNTHKTINDWNHIEKNFNWKYFTGHSPEEFPINEIRYKLELLREGKFYDVILEDKGLNVVNRLLTTERYISFLNEQLSGGEKKGKSIEVKPAPIKKTPSRLSFSIDYTKHKRYKTEKLPIIKNDFEVALKDMRTSLIKYKYIDASTTPKQFLNIFLEKEIEEKIRWLRDNSHLKFFIKKLYPDKLKPVKGEKKWLVASYCFDIGKDESMFSDFIRKAPKISQTDEEQLNICISHLDKV
ncbi:MAG TPA: hypothetical protein VNX01_11805 [Bacteroidia bacterium]|jgi:hypothetical protein|nr:hypothetical protein [Bacteroidia bacterium]